jgi:hypothetical protein
MACLCCLVFFYHHRLLDDGNLFGLDESLHRLVLEQLVSLRELAGLLRLYCQFLYLQNPVFVCRLRLLVCANRFVRLS